MQPSAIDDDDDVARRSRWLIEGSVLYQAKKAGPTKKLARSSSVKPRALKTSAKMDS
jgi:hypothetical protein